MRLLLAATIVVLTSISARAELFVEPFIGGAISPEFKGEVKIEGETDPLVSDTKLSGAVAGARVGWQLGSFGLGVSYMGGKYETRDKSKDLDSEPNDFKTSDIGFYVRFDIKRLHVFYTFTSTNAKDMSLNEANYKESLSGGGMHAGIGVKIIKNVALNVEYVSSHYDKANELKFTEVDADFKATIVSLSFPFSDLSALKK